MRPDTRSVRAPRRRNAVPGVHAALAGSLAILMSAAPAHAADGVQAREHSAPTTSAGPVGSPHATALSARLPHAVRAASAVPDTYTVQRGDTVSAIASRHGLRTVDVLALNALTWSSIIQPGQVLRLAAAAVAPPAAPPAAPAAPAATAPAGRGYVVRAGDTISAIAKAHGVSVQAVFTANGLGWSSLIFPGQTLVVAGVAPAAPPAQPPAPAVPAAPAAASGSYLVLSGDTISAIAQRHGVSTRAVLDANGLSRSSIIYPGQTIAIPAAAAAATEEPIVQPASTALDAEQIANSRIIIGIGRELGVSDRGIAIALGTAMQESWLRNLDWGDRDSLGLFQQRPSTGWGTTDEVRDAARSARAFYGGRSDPNGDRTRGLLEIPGWENLPFAEAAQAVQISAYPDRYAQWEQPAYAWLAALG